MSGVQVRATLGAVQVQSPALQWLGLGLGFELGFELGLGLGFGFGFGLGFAPSADR